MATGELQTVSGRVASVNAKGFRLEGHDSWLNLSKFARDVVLPERGQHVTVNLDDRGFVRFVGTTDGAPRVAGASLAGRPTMGPLGLRPDPHGDAPAPRGTVDRERVITRLAVLKAAAQFAGFRGDLKSGDVLTIAASWERWVLRGEPLPEPDDDDLVDEAF